MAGAGRVGADAAGGPILAGANSVLINGCPAARLLSPVAGHGKNEHAGPVMIGCNMSVIVEGLPICKTGDTATCGHPLVPGSPDVMVG